MHWTRGDNSKAIALAADLYRISLRTSDLVFFGNVSYVLRFLCNI